MKIYRNYSEKTTLNKKHPFTSNDALFTANFVPEIKHSLQHNYKKNSIFGSLLIKTPKNSDIYRRQKRERFASPPLNYSKKRVSSFVGKLRTYKNNFAGTLLTKLYKRKG
jgi:hypothetical protein